VKKILLPLALLFSITLPQVLMAQTLYVSDQLETNMRSGPSTGHRIIRMLKSGDPVTVLETSAATGYSRIRNQGGTEGWILTRHLMNEPHPRAQLEEFAEINTIRRNLEARLKEAQSQIQSLSGENQTLKNDLDKISRTAANTIAIERQNQALQKQRTDLELELQTLYQIKSELERKDQRLWMITGASVLGFGFLMGLLIPKIRFQKRNSWDTL
jgi:SH3 domain protein